MAAYFISDIVVTDPEGIKEYQQRVGASLELYGGKFLVRGGTFEVMEGDWHPHRLILLEFESVEQAKRWYNSAEYASVKGIRHRTANTDFVLVQGLYFEPTLFGDAPTGSEILTREVFGPVLTFQSFETEEEAIALSNDTDQRSLSPERARSMKFNIYSMLLSFV